MKIVALKHLDWSVCIGGRHVTGEIHTTGEIHNPNGATIELIKQLSVKEAKLLAEREGRAGWGWPLERETNKFDSLEELEQAAIKWCEKNVEGDWLLLHNDVHNINRPIAGCGFIEKRISLLTEIWQIWDKMTDREREATWKEMETVWNKSIYFL